MGTEETGDIKRKGRSEPAGEEEMGEIEGVYEGQWWVKPGCEGLRLRFGE